MCYEFEGFWRDKARAAAKAAQKPQLQTEPAKPAQAEPAPKPAATPTPQEVQEPATA